MARLAGLPAAVTSRAAEVLKLLESEQAPGKGGASLDDLPLFATTLEEKKTRPSPLREALDASHPDELTPRSALDLIYRLKAIARDEDD